MGCNNSKASALQELEQIIHQISIENDQLEKERDKLESQHDDRPEEEKDSLQDLRLMHSDLEKEIKEIMLDFMPIPESKDKNFLLIKSSIERIAEIQLEIEDQSTMLEEMTIKRKSMQNDHKSLEAVIVSTEQQIKELENAIEAQEACLKEQGGYDAGIMKYDKHKSLIITEIGSEEDSSSSQSHEEVKMWDPDENSTSSDKQSYETLLMLSENEINKELKDVESELEELSAQIKSLDLTEVELQQMNNYIANLRNKIRTTAKNTNIKLQIIESQQQIEVLKQEKRKIKQEVRGLKKYSGSCIDEGTNKKIQALNDILQQRKISRDQFSKKSSNDTLVVDIEETLKKARELSINIKKH